LNPGKAIAEVKKLLAGFATKNKSEMEADALQKAAA